MRRLLEGPGRLAAVWGVRRSLRMGSCALALATASPAMVRAQAPPPPSPPDGALIPTASLRARGEGWDWFGDAPEGEYGFVGALLRVGVQQSWRTAGWRLELAAPALLGLPDDATVVAPRGQLGLGGAYYAANDARKSPASLFVKQAFVRFGQAPSRGGHSLRLGRFEFIEGTEVAQRDPTVAVLKRDRIAHRLLGNFGWTHVGRSLDGAHYAYDAPGRVNVTLLGALPTRGVFDVEGMSALDVRVAYFGATRAFDWSGGRGEWRLFALGYQDRRNVVKTDNRPLAVRQGDPGDVMVGTLGAHYLHVLRTPVGSVDLLAWGALQGGDWGRLAHHASALAAEIGLQPGDPSTPLRPWLRAGWFRGSGDDDAIDGRHGTFFEVLPTPRIYARMPFFNLMNVDDVFASLSLRAGRVTLRSDLHGLRLASPADLWYQGGGAFERQTFGFVGRPSNGGRGLATLLDASAEVRAGPLTLSAYAAHASERTVISRLFPGGAGRLFYLEAELRR